MAHIMKKVCRDERICFGRKNHDHVWYLTSYVYYSMRKNVGQLIIILSISIILAKMKVSCESIKYIQQSENFSAI